MDERTLSAARAAEAHRGCSVADFVRDQLAFFADPSRKGGRPVNLPARRARLLAQLAEVERQIAAGVVR